MRLGSEMRASRSAAVGAEERLRVEQLDVLSSGSRGAPWGAAVEVGERLRVGLEETLRVCSKLLDQLTCKYLMGAHWTTILL